MLIIGLSYLALPILLMLYFTIFTKHRILPISLLAILLALYLIFIYFQLPSRNLLSIIDGNFFSGLLYMGCLIPLMYLSNHHEGLGKADVIGTTIGGIAVGILFISSIGGAISSHMVVKPTYNSIVKTYAKTREAPTFKRGETPIALSPSTVLNRVRKASSDIPNTQYYTISNNVQAQYYQGRPVYIVPIEYNGFWQMVKAKSIPGYFMIDATRQNATAHFVKQDYKFATSAYFKKDAERQIYRHCPEWLSIESPQLEIDDHGQPFWVQTLYQPEPLSHRINYRKLEVAVMNAKTGEVKTYPTNQLPKFIDEGITTGVASRINDDFGKYKYGYWNTKFGKTGIMKPTGNGVENGVTSVFNRDGSISYFTDFTTDRTGGDSALGYSMINARNGHLTFYQASNIMDSDGATDNADQNYRAQHWNATMPILYNINGHPTWVMNILDATNAIRGYYYLDASDQSIHGSGSTPTSALDDFRQSLVNNGGNAGNTDKAKMQNVSGTLDRVAVVSADKKVMFTLKNSKTIYTVNTDDYPNANLMRPDDQVTFKASILDNKSVGNVRSFVDKELQ